jgi:hypothetical protein
VPNKLRSARYLTAQRKRPLVERPHFGKEARGRELCQDGSIDRIRLDLCVRDHPSLLRVGYDHSINKGFKYSDDA